MGPHLILKTATRIAVLLLLLATSAVSSCSIAGVRQTPATTPDSPDPLADFTGLWSGTSTSTVNAATVKVSFDVKREGNELKGTYRCAPLNAVCRNNVQRGWMHGNINARGFTVSMEDTSWCAFMLDEFYPAWVTADTHATSTAPLRTREPSKSRDRRRIRKPL